MNALLRNITHRQLLLLVALVSSATLGGALIGQYFFDLHPCHLCILQRWPHGVIIAMSLIGVTLATTDQSRKLVLIICVIGLLVSATFATYHAGVESGFFKGPDDCSADAAEVESLEDLRAQIANAALVSCTQAMAYVFGLSLAAWNALISLAMALFVLWHIMRKKRDAIAG